MRRAAAAVVLLVVVVGSPPAGAQVDDQNCTDFPSQASAQLHLRADPSDPDRLDADNDGIACEANPAPQDLTPVVRSQQVTTTTVAATTTTRNPTATTVPGATTVTTVAPAPTTTVAAAPAEFGRTGFSPPTLFLALGLMLLGWRVKVGARVVPRPVGYDVLPRETLRRRIFG